ncbi:MAG TPA: C-terminal binding protein [Candidatus Binatia bacterium]|jgi:D-3-phosphoglycerate dehydrogenase|nr:C-terminal binding protein [Candidatus Binatia bacterium]
MSFVVAVTDYVFPSLEPEQGVLAPLGVDLRSAQCKSEEEIIELTQGADGVLNCYAKMTTRVIENLSRCKIIARYGIGVDNVDLLAATRAGILVTNVPDYCIDEVSDHALALLLTLARHIVAADRAVKAGAWDVVAHAEIHRLRGQTLGLLGFGKIARAVASKVQPLGMKVLAYDPYIEPALIVPHGAEAVNLERILAEADVISIHVPLSPETRNLIGESELARMKPTAFVINTSRGGIVDEQALAKALTAKRLGGAALDVLSVEPPPSDHPLRQAPNVILTPHLGFYSRESVVELQTKAAEEVARALKGEPPRSPINREVLAR